MTTLIRNPRVSSVPPDLRPRAVPPRAPAHTPPSTIADALSPLTDAQLRAQAHELVTAETKPILDEINKLNAQQSSRGQAAITGYTQALGHDLAQYMDRARAAYGPAEQSQGATDAALSSELHGGGSVVANALTSRLGSGYDPALVASLAEKANQTAAGSSGAEFAKGSAERSKLIAEGGHAAEYASKLPFFAELAGLQKSKDLQSQLSSDLATQTGEVTSKVPESVVSLFNDLRGREIQKQIARDSGLLNNRKVNASITAAEAAATARRARQSTADRSLTERERHDRATEQAARDRAAAKKGKPPYTQREIDAYRGKAESIIGDGAHGYDVVQKDDQGHNVVVHKPPVSMQMTVERLKRAGVPASVYLQILKQIYGPILSAAATAREGDARKATRPPGMPPQAGGGGEFP